MTLAEVWAAAREAFSEGNVCLLGCTLHWSELGGWGLLAAGYELSYQGKDDGWRGHIEAPGRTWLLQADYNAPPRQLYLCWNPWEGG